MVIVCRWRATCVLPSSRSFLQEDPVFSGLLSFVSTGSCVIQHDCPTYQERRHFDCTVTSSSPVTMVSQLDPTPTDGYGTYTSNLQRETEDIITRHIPPQGTAHAELQKKLHFEFLLRNLRQGFPERYTSQDASQPWLMYWTLHGFSILGVGLDDQTKKR